MHFGDSIFIFLLALVLFGPKKLPEIGRQIGKLLAEFRRASNEFKFQIQEEMRNLEDEERRKKAAERDAQAKTAQPAPEPQALPAETAPAGPVIQPPSTGAPVSTSFGYSYPGPAPDTPEVPHPGEAPQSQLDLPLPPETPALPPSAIAPERPPDPAPADLLPHTNGANPTPAHDLAPPAHDLAPPAPEPDPEIAHHD